MELTTADFTASPFKPKIVQRPRQQVEEQIRAAIRNGVVKTGQKLPTEVALSRDFGVSRTTVREALRSLVADGLIEKVPGAGGGSFVRALDHHTFGEELGQDMQNLVRVGSIAFQEAAEVRRMLEVPCVRLAAENRTQDEVSEMRAIVDQQKTSSHDDPVVPELDVRLHSLIGAASGNRVAAAFVQALHQVTEPVHHLDLDAEVGERTVRQHIAIVRAIEKQNPDAAEKAMIDHLSYLEEHMRPDPA
ncbi:GntR family transcriptional regulator [Mycobacterium holsaticum DSM 44478]|nr:GntR family transcriptional regulator [Mycolicibacterium holsaticum DSM 44478 = JCM 12374]